MGWFHRSRYGVSEDDPRLCGCEDVDTFCGTDSHVGGVVE